MHVSEVCTPINLQMSYRRPCDAIYRVKHFDVLWNMKLVQVYSGCIVTKGTTVDTALEQDHKHACLPVLSEGKVFLFLSGKGWTKLCLPVH